jgi:hypothetical protein
MSGKRRRLTAAQRAAAAERMRAAWRAGKFARKPKSIRPDVWTAAHDQLLRSLVGQYPPAEIAARLTARFPATPRTATAVLVRLKRLGLSPVLAHYTARQVAYLFGVDDKTPVVSWVRRGWLGGTQLQPGKSGSSWVFTAEQVEAFIRKYRHCYDWRAMPPGRWRSLAELEWRRDPLQTVPEAARVLGCAPETIRRYLRDGRLAGYRRLEKSGAQDGRWLIARSALASLRVDAASPGFTVIPRAEAEALVAGWHRQRGQAARAGRRRTAGGRLEVGA